MQIKKAIWTRSTISVHLLKKFAIKWIIPIRFTVHVFVSDCDYIELKEQFFQLSSVIFSYNLLVSKRKCSNKTTNLPIFESVFICPTYWLYSSLDCRCQKIDPKLIWNSLGIFCYRERHVCPALQLANIHCPSDWPVCLWLMRDCTKSNESRSWV